MSFALQKLLSEEEYLAAEEKSPVKREFVAGRVYAMAGASERHNLLAGNLFAAVHRACGGNCRPFFADMRLRLDGGGIYYYPDLMIVCDPGDDDPYFKTSPCMIAEVLSPETESTDRREKLVAYQKLPSLREYLLVAQDQVRVEVFHRVTLREWGLTTLGRADTLELKCIPLRLPVTDLYRGVDSGRTPTA
jgi:Uma2 family endonuclease